MALRARPYDSMAVVMISVLELVSEMDRLMSETVSTADRKHSLAEVAGYSVDRQSNAVQNRSVVEMMRSMNSEATPWTMACRIGCRETSRIHAESSE